MFPPSVAVTRQLWSLTEHMRLKATTRRHRFDGMDLGMLITIHIRLQKVLGLCPRARSQKSGSEVILFQTDPRVTDTEGIRDRRQQDRTKCSLSPSGILFFSEVSLEESRCEDPKGIDSPRHFVD